jgi:hypothetical protein
MTTATAIENAINAINLPKVYMIEDKIARVGYSWKPKANTRELRVLIVGGDIPEKYNVPNKINYCEVVISQCITYDNQLTNTYCASSFGGSAWPYTWPNVFVGGEWNGHSYNSKHLSAIGMELIVGYQQPKCKKCGENVTLARTWHQGCLQTYVQEDIDLYDAGICPKCR